METIIKKVLGYVFITPSLINVVIFFIDFFNKKFWSLHLTRTISRLDNGSENLPTSFIIALYSFHSTMTIAFALLAIAGVYLIKNSTNKQT